jgi:uncharacterized protein (DUF58 family)
VPVVLEDPLEVELPAVGLVDMEDPETGERMVVDTSSPLVRNAFAQTMRIRRDERTRLFKKLELDFIELRAGEEYQNALVRFFKARSRRLAA